MSRVLVEIEPTLWGRVKARALERGVKLPEAVGQALRGWLSFEGGSVAAVAGEQPPAAERREAVEEPVATGRPSVADLKRLVATTGAAVGTGRDLAERTLDVTPRFEGATLARAHEELDRVDAYAEERRRRAAQDRLRTHPEDASQDPDVDF